MNCRGLSQPITFCLFVQEHQTGRAITLWTRRALPWWWTRLLARRQKPQWETSCRLCLSETGILPTALHSHRTATSNTRVKCSTGPARGSTSCVLLQTRLKKKNSCKGRTISRVFRLLARVIARMTNQIAARGKEVRRCAKQPKSENFNFHFLSAN